MFGRTKFRVKFPNWTARHKESRKLTHDFRFFNQPVYFSEYYSWLGRVSRNLHFYENLRTLFLQAECPFCRPTNNVKVQCE